MLCSLSLVCAPQVSMFMDRDTTPLPKSQIGFVRLLVQPLFDAMSHFLTRMRPPSSALLTAPSSEPGKGEKKTNAVHTSLFVASRLSVFVASRLCATKATSLLRAVFTSPSVGSAKASDSDHHANKKDGERPAPMPGLMRAATLGVQPSVSHAQLRARSKSLWSHSKDDSSSLDPVAAALTPSFRLGSSSWPLSQPGSAVGGAPMLLEQLMPQLLQANVAMWEQAQVRALCVASCRVLHRASVCTHRSPPLIWIRAPVAGSLRCAGSAGELSSRSYGDHLSNSNGRRRQLRLRLAPGSAAAEHVEDS